MAQKKDDVIPHKHILMRCENVVNIYFHTASKYYIWYEHDYIALPVTQQLVQAGAELALSSQSPTTHPYPCPWKFIFSLLGRMKHSKYS